MATPSDRLPHGDRPPQGKRRPAQADRSTPTPGKPPLAPKDDAPLIPERSRDDSDAGWNDGPDSNDERLRRDVPPHW
jgi:hypothetical protein